jgi:hypothetical protein
MGFMVCIEDEEVGKKRIGLYDSLIIDLLSAWFSYLIRCYQKV